MHSGKTKRIQNVLSCARNMCRYQNELNSATLPRGTEELRDSGNVLQLQIKTMQDLKWNLTRCRSRERKKKRKEKTYHTVAAVLFPKCTGPNAC